MDVNNGIRGYDLYLGDRRVFVHLIHQWEQNALRVNSKTQIELNRWTHLFVTCDGSGKAAGIKLYINGKPAAVDVTHDRLSGTIKTEKPLTVGSRNPGAPFKGMVDEIRLYSRALTVEEVDQLTGLEMIRAALETPEEKRTDDQNETLRRYYLQHFDEPYRKLNFEVNETRRKRAELDACIPTTMVMQEMEKPRETHILRRGEYDQKGEKVAMGTPEALLPMPKEYPSNRLGLARWLVNPAHPLTSRVAVNRFWQMFFGTGIVRTAEDFGVQGERPTHPELLDWLATEFIRLRWDIKALQKMIVTSAAYRQSSCITPEHLERDPENRLLARAPRLRLQAEAIRDLALAVSGLLVEKIGGPSVKPYHPAGLWEELAFGGGFSAQKYEQDRGEALYRRSMYTFWKRTVPPPSLQTFDAPEREFCVVRRSATNTPLQALVLMNDPIYVESARKFAERIMQEAGASPESRIRYALETTLSRPPKPMEAQALLRIYHAQVMHYRRESESANRLLSVGESPRNEKLDTAELAALSTIVGIIFNLDETITRG
jgi:hypothetical protein